MINVSGNLDLMLSDVGGEKQHILTVALQQVLDTLTTPAEAGKWKPKLSGVEVLAISEQILNEVVKNPIWITDKANDDSLLKEVLGVTFNALQNVPDGNRINFETLDELIEINLRAVAFNKWVLNQENEDKKSILSQSLDLVFDAVFGQPSSVDKSELLVDTLDFALESIILKNPNKAGLVVLASFLQKELGIVSSTGIDENYGEQFIASAFMALAENPELISDKIGIQSIVTGVSKTLAQHGLKQPHIVSEFTRLIIENTAGNLHLIIDSSKRTEKNILVLALQQVLKATSKRPSSGKWKPALSPTQILSITEDILEEVLANPQWVKNNFMQLLISSVYDSLESVPSNQPLHYSTVKNLIQKSIQTINLKKQLAIKLLPRTEEFKSLLSPILWKVCFWLCMTKQKVQLVHGL